MGEQVIKKDPKISKAEFLKWFMPLLQALCDLGGSATPLEARNKIIENEHLTDNLNKFGICADDIYTNSIIL